ncbi:MAG TPA: DUF305 domain-containing protein [Sphingomicrobium sp.]|nr:DUF305 domain-containing protein [Sphingomicrobium sp.]
MLRSGALLVAAAAFAPAATDGFEREMNAAMDRMMGAMHVRRGIDADRRFVEMMIPHHQGAIDMAVAELRHGDNPRLRRIAQEIIVDQQQEIAAMRLAIGDGLPPAVPAPTRPTGGEGEHGLARR